MDMQRLFGLEGRIALVTGGSRGIGRMIVEGFLSAGCARVYICARKQDQLDEAQQTLGDTVTTLQADLSTIDGIRSFAKTLNEREQHLDILVNNAGAAWGEDYNEFSEAGWDKTLDLNLKAPFFLTQQLHSLLLAGASAERPAKVIMIASVDGLTLNPLETYPYQASKAGLIQMTKRMAARLVRENIIVSGIAPGAFPSEMNRAARDQSDFMAKLIPSARVGIAEDMAGAAIYLASRAGDYVVGSTIPVDGGWVNANIGGGFGPASGAK